MLQLTVNIISAQIKSVQQQSNGRYILRGYNTNYNHANAYGFTVGEITPLNVPFKRKFPRYRFTQYVTEWTQEHC